MSVMRGKGFRPYIGRYHSTTFSDSWITSTPTDTLPVGGYSGYQFTYDIQAADATKYSELHGCVYRYRLYLTGKNENASSNNIYFQTFVNDVAYHSSNGPTAVATDNYWTTYVDVDGISAGDTIGVKLYASLADMTITHSSAIILPNALYITKQYLCMHKITLNSVAPTNGVNPGTVFPASTYWYYFASGTASKVLDASANFAGSHWYFGNATYPGGEGVHYSMNPLGNGVTVSATYSPYCRLTKWPTAIKYYPIYL